MNSYAVVILTGLIIAIIPACGAWIWAGNFGAFLFFWPLIAFWLASIKG